MEKPKKKLTVKKAILLVLAALLVWALLYVLGPAYPQAYYKAPAADAALADWMSHIDGSKRLSEINIPGTHDSATQYIFPDYFLRDQNEPISVQLEQGYRYVDVRVALTKDGAGLEMIHAFGACRRGPSLFSGAISYDSVCDDAIAFLRAHPGETVIFCIKPERSSDDPAAVCAIIEKRAAAESDMWYTGSEIPTLDEARGKIVLCRRYDGELGMDFNWIDQGDPTVLADPIGWHDVNGTQRVAVQDRYHYSVADKWTAVLYTFDNCPADADTFTLNFLSTAVGKLPHPVSFAKDMNASFSGFELETGKAYGVVIFDFAEASLAEKVIASNPETAQLFTPAA